MEKTAFVPGGLYRAACGMDGRQPVALVHSQRARRYFKLPAVVEYNANCSNQKLIARTQASDVSITYLSAGVTVAILCPTNAVLLWIYFASVRGSR